LKALNVATSIFKPYTMPIAVLILIGLFAIQSRGTGTVGKAFGPVMFVWFATIALLGMVGIVIILKCWKHSIRFTASDFCPPTDFSDLRFSEGYFWL